MPSSRRKHLRIVVTVSQEQNKTGGELTQANIAKLHYIFLKCLKIYNSLRVNPFKEIYIFMFAF